MLHSWCSQIRADKTELYCRISALKFLDFLYYVFMLVEEKSFLDWVEKWF